MAALKVPVLEGLLYKISLEFDKIDPNAMADELDTLLVDSIERPATAPEEAPKAKPAPGGKSALAQYATNLTERAKAGSNAAVTRWKPITLVSNVRRQSS